MNVQQIEFPFRAVAVADFVVGRLHLKDFRLTFSLLFDLELIHSSLDTISNFGR